MNSRVRTGENEFVCLFVGRMYLFFRFEASKLFVTTKKRFWRFAGHEAGIRSNFKPVTTFAFSSSALASHVKQLDIGTKRLKLWDERKPAQEVRREAIASGTLERVPQSVVQVAGDLALATLRHWLSCEAL